MKPPVLDGSPCRRKHSRVAVIFAFLVFLSFTLFSSDSLAVDDQPSKAVRRASSEGAKKVALVIGNKDYKDVPLRNPVNDAEDLSSVLKRLGFSVITKTNANRKELEDAIDQFSREIRDAQVALFYFSGHGCQAKGENYLVPVGDNFSSEADLRYRAVNAGFVLEKMEEAKDRINIMILDACRNNPFKGVRSAARGLTALDAPPGSFIAYATAPGTVASDGQGRNSVYTKHLLRAIESRGLAIEQAFKMVGREVQKETNNQQNPWTSSSLTTDFCFNPLNGQNLAGGEQEAAKLRAAERAAALEKERLEKVRREHEQEIARLREAEKAAALEKERLEREKRGREQELAKIRDAQKIAALEKERVENEKRQEESALARIKQLSVDYYDAIINGDKHKRLSLYDFPMSQYFSESNASRSFVENDMDSYYDKWSRRSGTLQSVSVLSGSPSSGSMVVRLIYDYRFVAKSGSVKRGRSTTDVSWQNLGGTWKIKATYEKVDRHE